MRYLYFKDGILKLNAKVASEEQTTEFGTPVVVEDAFVLTTPTGEESDGIAVFREKTKSEIESELTYSTKRIVSYPPIGDQLDALFHGGAFPQEMTDKIQAVKDAHPKP